MQAKAGLDVIIVDKIRLTSETLARMSTGNSEREALDIWLVDDKCQALSRLYALVEEVRGMNVRVHDSNS